MKRRHSLASVALATALLASAATGARAAEEAASDKVNLGALSFTFDSSFTTAYMFRGILNIRDGLIWQPSAELSVNLFQADEGVVRSVDIGAGIWASIQTDDVAGAPGSDGRYENDYYPTFSMQWAGGVTSTLSYYFYTSPNGTFGTVEEATLDLSYDDSELLGPFAVSPTVTFATETHNSSLGNGKGSVAVLGISPGYTFNKDGDYSLALTFPVNLALSIDDYYRVGTRNDVFGYATLGLHAAVPLAFIPKRYGSWTVTNGFDVYFLDRVLENINQGDEVYPVWTSSITLEY